MQIGPVLEHSYLLIVPSFSCLLILQLKLSWDALISSELSYLFLIYAALKTLVKILSYLSWDVWDLFWDCYTWIWATENLPL
jgi:hypothetical protein